MPVLISGGEIWVPVLTCGEDICVSGSICGYGYLGFQFSLGCGSMRVGFHFWVRVFLVAVLARGGDT